MVTRYKTPGSRCMCQRGAHTLSQNNTQLQHSSTKPCQCPCVVHVEDHKQTHRQMQCPLVVHTSKSQEDALCVVLSVKYRPHENLAQLVLPINAYLSILRERNVNECLCSGVHHVKKLHNCGTVVGNGGLACMHTHIHIHHITQTEKTGKEIYGLCKCKYSHSVWT